jgi:DNA replication protein DnaC
MKTGIHTDIQKQYERKRFTKISERDERLAEVYKALPAVEDADFMLSKLGLYYNKQIFQNPENTELYMNKMKMEAEVLKSERNHLLVSGGFSPEYLELEYFCKQCKDTGFIGDVEAPKKCSCYRQLMVSALSEKYGSMMPETAHFEDFDENCYSTSVNPEKYLINISPRENIIYNKNKCLDFIDGFNNTDGKSLLFAGPTGTGKSFLANMIAHRLINTGFMAVHQSAPRLFDNLNASKWKNSGFEEDDSNAADIIYDADLLIIDDLGTEPQSPSRYAGLLDILERRASENHRRPCRTIISTNLDIKSFREFYDERVISRIIGGFDFLKFAGDDLRRSKKLSQQNTSGVKF